MERAKRIATAFIGVAFAANYCEPACAQAPDRFIRQPAKAPANPAPIAPAPSITAPSSPTPSSPTPSSPTPSSPTPSSPTLSSPAPIGPTPNIPAPTASNQNSTVTTVSLAPSSPAPVTGSEAPKLDLREPLSAISTDSLLSFPSLVPVVDLPDLSFDSLESFATVPDSESKKTAKQTSTLDGQAAKSQTITTSQQTSSTTTSAPTFANRSGQLQWTARANVNSSRTETYNSQPQFDANSNRSTPAFNTRSTIQREFSQQDFQSATAAKQQADTTNELLSRIANDFESIKSKVNKEDEPAKENRIRASLVSERITNDPRYRSQSPSQSSVARIESPQGWQAIGTRLSYHIRKCESLLGRGAFCSAREEAETASMLLYRHIDLHDNMFRCEPAVQSANQALREAEDFLVTIRASTDGESIRRLVDAHETPVLKNKNLSGMSPLTAAQHYRQYAESQLVEAAQGHPWASELLYTVGRTYQAEADDDDDHVDVLRMKAMAYYRAACITLPTNAVACNQLGYLLLQMDRNTEAREALVAAVSLKQDEAFLANLAEASRRLGDNQTVAWAAQHVAAIRSRTPPPSPVPPYVTLSQEDFIAISPREIGPKTPAEPGAVQGLKSADRSASAPNMNQLR